MHRSLHFAGNINFNLYCFSWLYGAMRQTVRIGEDVDLLRGGLVGFCSNLELPCRCERGRKVTWVMQS